MERRNFLKQVVTAAAFVGIRSSAGQSADTGLTLTGAVGP